jgi:exodeoxyribonuclease VII large subunit
LPRHPRTIGVVTSMQAAALRDVLTTLARRAPHVCVIVFPTPVQGQDAPVRIAEAIATASRHPVDILLVVRGGGSIEDLWAFNDERVAHAIAASVVPVVSGVGHETDFTIADFVADLRAPTPTAAAELASPDASALVLRLLQHRQALRRANERALNTWSQRVDDAARRLRSPDQRLDLARARTEALAQRLARAQNALVAERLRVIAGAAARLQSAAPDVARLALRPFSLRDRLARAVASRVRAGDQSVLNARQRLGLLDPRGVLARGYAIATDADGRVIRDAAGVVTGQHVTVEVARGRFVSRVVDSDD